MNDWGEGGRVWRKGELSGGAKQKHTVSPALYFENALCQYVFSLFGDCVCSNVTKLRFLFFLCLMSVCVTRAFTSIVIFHLLSSVHQFLSTSHFLYTSTKTGKYNDSHQFSSLEIWSIKEITQTVITYLYFFRILEEELRSEPSGTLLNPQIFFFCFPFLIIFNVICIMLILISGLENLLLFFYKLLIL